MKRQHYKPHYPMPGPEIFAVPVPSRPINPVSERRVLDLLWCFAERLEHEADARNIAAARVRRMIERGTLPPEIPTPNPPRRRRSRFIPNPGAGR